MQLNCENPTVSCRIGTIDARIAHLAIAGGHTLLTTDSDIGAASGHIGPTARRP
jgi:predicted nucleic acid-binding protein